MDEEYLKFREQRKKWVSHKNESEEEKNEKVVVDETRQETQKTGRRDESEEEKNEKIVVDEARQETQKTGRRERVQEKEETNRRLDLDRIEQEKKDAEFARRLHEQFLKEQEEHERKRREFEERLKQRSNAERRERERRDEELARRFREEEEKIQKEEEELWMRVEMERLAERERHRERQDSQNAKLSEELVRRMEREDDWPNPRVERETLDGRSSNENHKKSREERDGQMAKRLQQKQLRERKRREQDTLRKMRQIQLEAKLRSRSGGQQLFNPYEKGLSRGGQQFNPYEIGALIGRGGRTGSRNPFRGRSSYRGFGSNSRFRGRRGGGSDLQPDLDRMSYEQILEWQERVGHVSRGASKQVIGHQTTEFTLKDPEKDVPKDCRKCVICLCDFEEGDKCRRLPCFHVYHVNCIDQWLKQNASCPICKTSIKKSS